MQGFINHGRKMPSKRQPKLRCRDYNEIFEEFSDDQARDQADRCAQCGVPFCQVHCPLENHIPDWLRLNAQGRMQEAYEIASLTNTFPEICGRICPQDKLCEGDCVIEQSGHGTVTIGAVERYITEYAFDKGWVKPRKPSCERAQSIGVIGAGPAGLAASEMLRAYGYQVTVYDRYDRVGGLMIYGIPNFKLEKHVVSRREKLLRDQGIKFRLNHEIKDLIELQAQHDCLLIACGVYKARALNTPGVGLDGVVQALDYLTASNRIGLGDQVSDYDSGRLNAKDKDVVVVGGGDTAMDCLRTAIRQKAKSVKCLYRRDRKNMPGSAREVKHAEEEGVEFIWLSALSAILGDPPGPVKGVRVSEMVLGEPDETGRRRPQKKQGAAYNLHADMVIKALGFSPEDLKETMQAGNLKTTPWGTLEINTRTRMTNLEGVFAAGDIVRGASLVVWAIREGRETAHAMHNYMQAKTGRHSLAAE